MSVIQGKYVLILFFDGIPRHCLEGVDLSLFSKGVSLLNIKYNKNCRIFPDSFSETKETTSFIYQAENIKRGNKIN